MSTLPLGDKAALQERLRQGRENKAKQKAAPVSVEPEPEPLLDEDPGMPSFLWEHYSTPMIERAMSALMTEWRRGAEHLQRRKSSEIPVLHCATCSQPIPEGRWKFKDDGYRDPDTGEIRTVYVGGPNCKDMFCYERYQQSRARNQGK